MMRDITPEQLNAAKTKLGSEKQYSCFLLRYAEAKMLAELLLFLRKGMILSHTDIKNLNACIQILKLYQLLGVSTDFEKLTAQYPVKEVMHAISTPITNPNRIIEEFDARREQIYAKYPASLEYYYNIACKYTADNVAEIGQKASQEQTVFRMAEYIQLLYCQKYGIQFTIQQPTYPASRYFTATAKSGSYTHINPNTRIKNPIGVMSRFKKYLSTGAIPTPKPTKPEFDNSVDTQLAIWNASRTSGHFI